MEAREIERCIDEFGADVYRFCLKLCMNREDAEDLYQQTFLKALECSFTLEWEKNPRAFFFAAAHNQWKSSRRKVRIPLILFYLFEFKVEQIGRMTGKSPGTVKSCLFKGRKMIKKRLEEAGYGEERF